MFRIAIMMSGLPFHQQWMRFFFLSFFHKYPYEHLFVICSLLTPIMTEIRWNFKVNLIYIFLIGNDFEYFKNINTTLSAPLPWEEC